MEILITSLSTVGGLTILYFIFKILLGFLKDCVQCSHCSEQKETDNIEKPKYDLEHILRKINDKFENQLFVNANLGERISNLEIKRDDKFENQLFVNADLGERISVMTKVSTASS